LDQTLNLICDAIRKVAGVKTRPATIPTNMLLHTMVRLGASDAPAREVLARAFAPTGWRMVWHLYCGANERSKGYYLNAHVVSVERTTRFGNKTLWPTHIPSPIPPK
jgi:hypothetical protein